jgi:hypothetical protein
VFERLVWFVPLVVAAFGIARPRAGLVALAAALPFFGASRGGPYLGALDAACLAAILACVRAHRGERTGLDRAVLAFAAVGVASFFPLAHQLPSLRPPVLAGFVHALANAPTWSGVFTWRALLDLLLGCGLYFSTRRAFADRPARPLALGVSAGLSVLVLLGLAEHAGFVDLDGYRTVAVEGRLQALFSNSGWFGEYVTLALPIGLAPLLASRPWARRAGYALLVLALAALALSQQRAAWLTVLVQCALVAAFLAPNRWREPRTRRVVLALATTTAVTVGLVGAMRPGLVTGLAGRWTNPDLFQRPHLWGAAAGLWLERPLAGWGIGTFEPVLEQRGAVTEVAQTAQGEAHSTVLHLAAERGLAGLFALALLIVAAARSTREALRRDPDRPMALGRALALVGAATYGLFQYLWYLPAVALLLWLVLGVGQPAPERGGERLVRRGAVLVAGLAAVLAAWRVLAGVPPAPVPDDRSYGFDRPEQTDAGTFQWTQGHAARQLDCRGQWLILGLANAHPAAPRHAVEVTVRVDGRRVAVRDAFVGWQEWTIPIGDACADGSAVVELVARPTFRPFSDFRRDPALPASRDERELGVAVRTLRIQ